MVVAEVGRAAGVRDVLEEAQDALDRLSEMDRVLRGHEATEG